MFLLLLLLPALAIANRCDCVDYYWRDYCGGPIPEDAVVGGYNRNSEPRYIGSVYVRAYEPVLLPATIYPRQGVAVATVEVKIVNTTQNVRILCSPHPEAFEWVATDTKNLYKYYNRVVHGGHELTSTLEIGKIEKNGEPLIGKVFPDNVSNKGLWYPSYAENRPANSLTYDLLVYNCYNVKCCSGVRRDKCNISA